MADLSDIEQALVNEIFSSVYPDGEGALSAVGVPIRLYRGRPTNAALIMDRQTGTADIGVYSLPGTTRNTTRWGVQVNELLTIPTLTVGTSGNSATFFGTATAGDIAGVLVDQKIFLYQAQNGDSASLVASALADAIRSTMICWLTQSTITVPGVGVIVARTASLVMTQEELCRQEQQFQICILAATPMTRDLVAQFVTQWFARLSFITLNDGTGARIRYSSAANADNDQAASIYRRDLNYEIEYGTSIVSNNPVMLFGDLISNGTTIYA